MDPVETEHSDHLACKHSNTVKFPIEEENLIDLNTPESEKTSKLSCRPGTDNSIPQATPVTNSNGVLPVDNTCNHLNPTSKGPAECNVNNVLLTTSHTESGYLTDSTTSTLSRERHTSVSSELDRTPGQETRHCSSSETDTTPCGEPLISFEDQKCEQDIQEKTKNASIDKHRDQNAQLIDIQTTFGEEQIEALAKLDLNRKQECNEIEEMFGSNFVASARPNVLYFDGKHTRSQSDYDVYLPDALHGHSKKYSSNGKYDSRKRSKSSGFPIPRVKEGVNITDETLSKSLPHGQLMRKETGMIEFIADDVEEMIRRSSPMSQSTCKTASSDVSSRRSSLLSLTSVESLSSTMATSMTSGMSRSYPQSPDCIPPIDPMAIYEIENQARFVADSLSHMMGNLQSNLHKMSAISVGCEEAYRTSVDVTCDSVDSSIKAMYALMAKCEELSSTMQPVYKLADQIKEIKRLLDRFESQLTDKP